MPAALPGLFGEGGTPDAAALPDPFGKGGAPGAPAPDLFGAGAVPADAARTTLESAWLHLTRVTLPALARTNRWPVSADHCFQRILLDNAVGGRWYDAVARRPAYRHLPDAVLARARALAEAVAAGDADLTALNARSLAWRTGRTPGR